MKSSCGDEPTVVVDGVEAPPSREVAIVQGLRDCGEGVPYEPHSAGEDAALMAYAVLRCCGLIGAGDWRVPERIGRSVAQAQASEWRPISTAPHDRFVLVYSRFPDPDDGPIVWAKWEADDGEGCPYWRNTFGSMINEPSLWTDVSFPEMAAKPSTGALSSSPHEQNTPSPPDPPEAIGDEVELACEAYAGAEWRGFSESFRAAVRRRMTEAVSALHQAGKLPATGGER